MRPSVPPDNTTSASAEELLTAALGPERVPAIDSPCPVDRLPKRRRNQICIAIITIGLANYAIYTVVYALIGGDARNGHHLVVTQPDGATTHTYHLRGGFIRDLSGQAREVSRGVWLYSHIHSITIPVTWGAVLLSMLVLARPHILATMRGGWLPGRAFVAVSATVIALIGACATALFTWQFIVELR